MTEHALEPSRTVSAYERNAVWAQGSDLGEIIPEWRSHLDDICLAGVSSVFVPV